MSKLSPVTNTELISRLKRFGFDGPYSGGKHLYMVKGNLRLTVPNPPELSLYLAKRAFPQSPVLSRNAAIYLIKKYTSLSNREIMPLFRPLKQSSISQMSRRFRQAIQKDMQIEQTTERLEKKINEFILNEI